MDNILLAALCLFIVVGQALAQLEDGENTAIDFSDGVVGADGSVCVEVEEERESLEQDTERQCTQQNVTQCFTDYNTEYRDEVREVCEEEFVKTCRIVMRARAYNHTTRVCRRPLVEECQQPSYGGYQAPGTQQPELVCETFYETECKEDLDAGAGGVIRCEQVERKICAEDNCSLVEGEEECEDEVVESTVSVPEENCAMDPETVCRNQTVSLPQLVPEESCRVVPREVCQDVFTNPRTVPTVKKVKYCTRPGEAEARDTEAAGAPERQRQRPGTGGQRQTPIQSLVPPAQQEIQALRQALALQQQQMAELISFQQQQQQRQQTQSQNRNGVFGRDNRNQKLRQSNFGNQNLRNGKASKSKNAKNISVFGKSGKQNPHQQQREEFLRQRALRLLNLHK